ncbi:MAG: M20/M25/M40 family metallo-hydrolase, partial [Candidatus Kariarchaeaceae archaeon]|jgi:acetylornithine deacetylase/succinyl-diaminopimelate desuccinylase-like protein
MDLQVAKGTRKSRSFTSSLADGGQSLHSMSFVLGSDTHAMIAAGKFSMDKNIISVSSSSIKTNSVPKEVVVDYIDYRGTNEIEYSAGLTKMMHALSSIGSIPLPIDKSKYGPAINPNLLDIDRDTGTVTVTFDIRSMVQASAHHLIAEEIQRHFAHYGLMTEYELQLVIDPVNVSPDHPLAVLTNEIAEKHGFQILTRGEKLGGASDTRFFTSLEIPGIELGPLAHNAHGTNEAVDLTSIEKLRDIYQELVQDILAGKLG